MLDHKSGSSTNLVYAPQSIFHSSNNVHNVMGSRPLRGKRASLLFSPKIIGIAGVVAVLPQVFWGTTAMSSCYNVVYRGMSATYSLSSLGSVILPPAVVVPYLAVGSSAKYLASYSIRYLLNKKIIDQTGEKLFSFLSKFIVPLSITYAVAPTLAIPLFYSYSFHALMAGISSYLLKNKLVNKNVLIVAFATSALHGPCCVEGGKKILEQRIADRYQLNVKDEIVTRGAITLLLAIASLHNVYISKILNQFLVTKESRDDEKELFKSDTGYLEAFIKKATLFGIKFLIESQLKDEDKYFRYNLSIEFIANLVMSLSNEAYKYYLHRNKPNCSTKVLSTALINTVVDATFNLFYAKEQRNILFFILRDIVKNILIESISVYYKNMIATAAGQKSVERKLPVVAISGPSLVPETSPVVEIQGMVEIQPPVVAISGPSLVPETSPVVEIQEMVEIQPPVVAMSGPSLVPETSPVVEIQEMVKVPPPVVAISGPSLVSSGISVEVTNEKAVKSRIAELLLPFPALSPPMPAEVIQFSPGQEFSSNSFRATSGLIPKVQDGDPNEAMPEIEGDDYLLPATDNPSLSLRCLLVACAPPAQVNPAIGVYILPPPLASSSTSGQPLSPVPMTGQATTNDGLIGSSVATSLNANKLPSSLDLKTTEGDRATSAGEELTALHNVWASHLRSKEVIGTGTLQIPPVIPAITVNHGTPNPFSDNNSDNNNTDIPKCSDSLPLSSRRLSSNIGSFTSSSGSSFATSSEGSGITSPNVGFARRASIANLISPNLATKHPSCNMGSVPTRSRSLLSASLLCKPHSSLQFQLLNQFDVKGNLTAALKNGPQQVCSPSYGSALSSSVVSSLLSPTPPVRGINAESLAYSCMQSAAAVTSPVSGALVDAAAVTLPLSYDISIQQNSMAK